jgi:hypothetical protein
VALDLILVDGIAKVREAIRKNGGLGGSQGKPARMRMSNLLISFSSRPSRIPLSLSPPIFKIAQRDFLTWAKIRQRKFRRKIGQYLDRFLLWTGVVSLEISRTADPLLVRLAVGAAGASQHVEIDPLVRNSPKK